MRKVKIANRPAKYNKLTVNEKIKVISGKLRVGDAKKAAMATGYTPSYVRDVITGRRTNSRILNKMYDITRSRKEVLI
jgi:hypothetical protein